jgi:hypothetical protein
LRAGRVALSRHIPQQVTAADQIFMQATAYLLCLLALGFGLLGAGVRRVQQGAFPV